MNDNLDKEFQDYQSNYYHSHHPCDEPEEELTLLLGEFYPIHIAHIYNHEFLTDNFL